MTTITKLKEVLDALETLACLGNGERPGNSIGNSIARSAGADLRSVIAEMEAGEAVASVNAVEWAVGKWRAEVENRPLVNVHRRSLDDTWRTVIRHFGGDDSKLLPLKKHDDLVMDAAQVAQPKAEPNEYKGWYCAHCQHGVDGSDVTSREQHTVCGRVIADDVPPVAQPKAEPCEAGAMCLMCPDQLKSEPVKYLANGARFKLTSALGNGAGFIGFPADLAGKWVALVDATDNRHIAAAPKEQSEPVRPQNCGSGFCSCIECVMDEPVREPLPPFGSKRKAAMEVYKAPFVYKYGYIYDSQNLMVADNGGIGKDEPGVEGAVAARVRGWGRLGYLPNGAELQDEIGWMMADALNALYATPQATHKESLTVEPVQEPVDSDDSFLLCSCDLEHSAIYDNIAKMGSCMRAVAIRIRALATAPQAKALPLKERPDFMAGYDAGMADAKRMFDVKVQDQPLATIYTCNNTLKMIGKPYPRTCKECGLGPCKNPIVANGIASKDSKGDV